MASENPTASSTDVNKEGDGAQLPLKHPRGMASLKCSRKFFFCKVSVLEIKMFLDHLAGVGLVSIVLDWFSSFLGSRSWIMVVLMGPSVLLLRHIDPSCPVRHLSI